MIEFWKNLFKDSWNIYIQNLVNNCKKGIILSWALPNQPGDGHVNCQPPEYVITLMESHGFT